MPRNEIDRGEATKPASTILRQEISLGRSQLGRPAVGLVLSGLSAGLDIGLGPMLMVTLLAIVPQPDVYQRLLMAGAYAVGFVIVILGRSELFTEHTTLAVLPLLSGQTTFGRVGRVWGLVYAGNLLGVILFAAIVTPLGRGLGLFGPGTLTDFASPLASTGTAVLFGSAVMAGWLMGLMSWLVTAARDTAAQVLIIVLVAGSIAFLGLHHSIAGSVEVLMAVFGAGLSATAWLRFLVISTAGNALGGVVLVALLKYGHVVSEKQRAR